ncbi:hypothetical protein BG015_006898, partial [Linnemannia schmuckeri]
MLSAVPSTDPASWTVPSTSSSALPKPPYYNLTVKQKAVCQPTFKHRLWLEDSKAQIPQGFDTSISEIESMLPALRDADASVLEYLEYLEGVEERLVNYYNGDRM